MTLIKKMKSLWQELERRIIAMDYDPQEEYIKYRLNDMQCQIDELKAKHDGDIK